MIAERPGGVSPSEPSKGSESLKAQKEQAQKVEKVREVDADEETQRRKRKFQMMMGDEDQLEGTDKSTRVPSPFEIEFYRAQEGTEAPASTTFLSGSTINQNDGLEEIDSAAVPSPSYSPPPSVNALPPEEEEPTALPRSHTFWEEADAPSPPAHPKLNETAYSQSRANRADLKKEKPGHKGKEGFPGSLKEDKIESSPFGVAGKEKEKKKKSTSSVSPFEMEKARDKAHFGAAPVKKKGKEESPLAAPKPMREEEKEWPQSAERKIAPPKIGKKEEARMRGEESSRKEEKKKVAAKKEEAESAPYLLHDQRERERRKQEDKAEIKPVSAMLPTLPNAVQQPAYAALTQAAPYLRPETLPLFFQMVGSMYVMVNPPGISRTEIVLNNPAFANSRFFGARITIEKYATAPDSFNIRLTGSDTAVTAFRENIPTLMNAFQNGNFSFRVNRLDAEFSIERPVFRRRERGEGGKDMGGNLGERRK